MPLYEIIFDFFRQNIFKASGVSASALYDLNHITFEIGGYSMTFAYWLCHMLTISILIFGVVVLMLVVRWIFRVLAGLIRV